MADHPVKITMEEYLKREGITSPEDGQKERIEEGELFRYLPLPEGYEDIQDLPSELLYIHNLRNMLAIFQPQLLGEGYNNNIESQFFIESLLMLSPERLDDLITEIETTKDLNSKRTILSKALQRNIINLDKQDVTEYISTGIEATEILNVLANKTLQTAFRGSLHALISSQEITRRQRLLTEAINNIPDVEELEYDLDWVENQSEELTEQILDDQRTVLQKLKDTDSLFSEGTKQDLQVLIENLETIEEGTKLIVLIAYAIDSFSFIQENDLGTGIDAQKVAKGIVDVLSVEQIQQRNGVRRFSTISQQDQNFITISRLKGFPPAEKLVALLIELENYSHLIDQLGDVYSIRNSTRVRVHKDHLLSVFNSIYQLNEEVAIEIEKPEGELTVYTSVRGISPYAA